MPEFQYPKPDKIWRILRPLLGALGGLVFALISLYYNFFVALYLFLCVGLGIFIAYLLRPDGDGASALVNLWSWMTKELRRKFR